MTLPSILAALCLTAALWLAVLSLGRSRNRRFLIPAIGALLLAAALVYFGLG